jgi:diacylglycerol kinase (ATP)
MRIALYFNPNAGVRTFDGEDVAGLFRQSGDEVRVFEKNEHDVAAAIDWLPDVLVAAGGDGTIAKAAIALFSRGAALPLYVLPMGTSNNIAFTLGIAATVPQLVQAMGASLEQRLDIGVAVNGRESPFVEAVGAGFFADAIAGAGGLRERLRGVLRRFTGGATVGEAFARAAAAGTARRLRHATAREFRVVADGEDFSGRYVAVEVMNIKAVGARAQLAPDADSGDGALDLVLVREEDREPLARFIEGPGAEPPPLERRRVREASIEWDKRSGHLDDGTYAEGPDVKSIRARIGGSVRLLLPRATSLSEGA